MSDVSTASPIAFLTEGGPAVGLGHLSRCAALARAAAAGARVSALVDGQGTARVMRMIGQPAFRQR